MFPAVYHTVFQPLTSQTSCVNSDYQGNQSTLNHDNGLLTLPRVIYIQNICVYRHTDLHFALMSTTILTRLLSDTLTLGASEEMG